MSILKIAYMVLLVLCKLLWLRNHVKLLFTAINGQNRCISITVEAAFLYTRGL